MSLNEFNEAYVCPALSHVGLLQHTQAMTHATKYAVSASKNKIQYCASSIFSIVFKFHF